MIFTSQYTAAQIDAGIALANSAYQKPQSGIPASDLANDVIPGDFGSSGTNHAHGLVPDPGATQGDTKFLREDGSWAVPAGSFTQEQADWNQSDNTAVDYIKNKPTIPNLSLVVSKSASIEIAESLGATDNNVFLSSISVNNHTITANLKDIYELPYVASKEDKMTVVTKSSGTSLTASVGNYYSFTYNVGTLTITLPTPTGSNVQSVRFFLAAGASPNVTFNSSDNTIYYNNGFAINASTTYEITALWNGGAWVINAVKYDVPQIIISI